MTRQDRLLASLVRLRRLQSDSATQVLASAIARQRAVGNAMADLDAAVAKEMAQADPHALSAWRAAVHVRRAQLSSALGTAERKVAAARETLRERSSLLELTKAEAGRRERLNRQTRLATQQLELDGIGLQRISSTPELRIAQVPPGMRR